MKKTLVLATAIVMMVTPVFSSGPDVKKGIAEGNSEMCENYAWAALEFAYAMTGNNGFAGGAAWYSVYNKCMAISS